MTGLARQTPSGARPSRKKIVAAPSGAAGGARRPVSHPLPGRLLEAPGNRGPREMVAGRRVRAADTEPGLQVRSSSLRHPGGCGRRVVSGVGPLARHVPSFLFVEQFHQLRDAQRVDADPHLIRLAFQRLVERPWHPHGDDPLGFSRRGLVALPGSEPIEHFADPGILRRALKPHQGFGIGERAANDALDSQHLPKKDDPLRVHRMKPLGDLQHRGGRMVVTLGQAGGFGRHG